MKDANKLTPLLRSDDLIQNEKARFSRMISQFREQTFSPVKTEVPINS